MAQHMRLLRLDAAKFRTKFTAYCRVDRKGTGASHPRGGRARDFVNFREKNYASRARGAAARV